MTQSTRWELQDTVEHGWWEANVPPEANPVEVVAVVTRLMPEHPALPRLVSIAQRYRESLKDRPPLFRCPSCLDVGQVEVSSAGRGTWRKCSGPMGSGCMR